MTDGLYNAQGRSSTRDIRGRKTGLFRAPAVVPIYSALFIIAAFAVLSLVLGCRSSIPQGWGNHGAAVETHGCVSPASGLMAD